MQRLKEPVMEEKTAETLKRLAVTTIRSIRQPVATLSGGQRQSVAVARAVMWNSKLVILDEPTAALGVAQTEQVLALVKRLADQGLAVILISHNLHDVFEVARPDHRAPARPQRRRLRARDRRRAGSRRRRSRPGSPTKVAGIASTSPEAPGLSAQPSLGRPDPTAGEHRHRVRDNVKGGQPRQRPGDRRTRDHRHLLRFTAQNFFTAVNFNNIITQMAGMTMLAYGVVFVLLIGEIDLSIGFVSGIGGVIVAELQQWDSGHHCPALWRSSSRSPSAL